MSKLLPWGLGMALTAAGSGVAILDQRLQLCLLLGFQFKMNFPSLAWGVPSQHPPSFSVFVLSFWLLPLACGSPTSKLAQGALCSQVGLDLWTGLITAEVAALLEIVGEVWRSPRITVPCSATCG